MSHHFTNERVPITESRTLPRDQLGFWLVLRVIWMALWGWVGVEGPQKNVGGFVSSFGLKCRVNYETLWLD